MTNYNDKTNDEFEALQKELAISRRFISAALQVLENGIDPVYLYDFMEKSDRDELHAAKEAVEALAREKQNEIRSFPPNRRE